MPLFANILQPLIDVFEEILKAIHSLGFSWGWSIVGMTVVVRAALVPLAIRQYKSMRSMQRLAPQIKALREKHGSDRERLNQETMKLYQEHRVNPFGACLPLVFQLPVFISLFYMLRHDLRLDICPTLANGQPNPPSNPQACGNIPAAEFLGIPDITSKAVGTTLVILIVLYVGTQLVSTIVMSMPNMDRNQRFLMLGLPFIFIPFVIGFPAGLLVYWITTNIWTLAQQFTIRETLGRRWDRQHEAALEAAGGDPSKAFGSADKGPGFFGSMMARAQSASETAKAGDGNGASASSKGSAAPAKGSPRPAASKGKPAATSTDAEKPSASAPRPAAAPPRSPRKKKKRSGRRR
jgi:YidC/Oxa1 family membrane protein insertase